MVVQGVTCVIIRSIKPACGAPAVNTILFMMHRPHPSLLGFQLFLAPSLHHHLLADTTYFDDGHKHPATERTRSCCLDVKCTHPNPEYRQGCLCYPTGPSRLRFCQCPLNYDQGSFSPILQSQTPDSRLFRIPWPTNGIMSTSGQPAPTCVKSSTGGWTGNG